MATHKKTIRVPINLGASGTIPDAALTTIGTPTIYIPENSVTNPVTFTSASMYVFAQDMSTATGGSLNEMRVDATLSGASTTTITETDDLPATGENWGGIFGPFDFTSHFTSNFGTVTANTCTTQVYFDISTGTVTTVNGVTAYWELTYTYDDSEPNRIQTIAIPMESITGALTTTVNTAYCTIPQLTGSGGWLSGYTTPVIHHIWAECKCASGSGAATTAQVLNWGFNGAGGGSSSDSRNNSLATNTFIFVQAELSGLTLSTSNTLDIWSSVATRYHCLVVNVYVSFGYVVSGTTKILNYAEIPIEYISPINGTTSAVAHRQQRTITIPEPGTITQRAIGVELGWNTNAASTAQMKVGSQASFRGYSPIGTMIATQFVIQHLADARSASGNGVTLTNGENEINIDLYRSAGSMTNVSGCLRVLYESDVSSLGVDSHTKIVSELCRQYDSTATGDLTVTSSFSIPETNYRLNSIGFEYYFFLAVAVAALAVTAEVTSGEAEGDGWRGLYQDYYLCDAENSFGLWRVGAVNEFKKRPNDPNSKALDIETARGIRTTSSTAFRFGIKLLITYSNIYFIVSGVISNSAGGTIDIEIFKVSTNELYATDSRVGDGSYSFTVYDEVEQYYVVARESSTKKGVSKDGTPATDFDIDLDPSGGSVIIGGRICVT